MRHSKVTRQFVLTLIIVFVLQATMLAYVFSAFYRSSVADIKDLGVSNLKSQATMVENYLDRGGNVLWFAAGSVDHLMRNGAGTERLQSYLVEETLRMQEQFDENFTGIYGLLNGEYIDGAGWVPPVGYEPKKRDWYVEGIEGKGKMILSAPYLDAQTGKIIISFTQMLSDGESVLSMDIILNEVQKITEEMTMDDVGYSFIVDGDGLVISHSDTSCVGKDYSEDPDWVPVLSAIYSEQGNEFEMVIDGRRSTVFSDRIEGDWYVVIVADNAVLYHTLRLQILAGILLSLAIYLIVVLFCIYSMKRIQKAEKGEEESLERLKTMNMNVIGSLASTIDAKDRYTSGHSRRVAEYSRELARRMGKSEEDQEIVFTAGLLHDVGKISVPGDVINKPGRLTDEEFDQIRIHPVSGYHILEGIHDDERIGYGAKYHHERYDGKGYPNGLQGEDIPKIANRLQSVARMNNKIAIRNARTFITAAENGGRQYGMEYAESIGVKLQKRWLATLDSRTRHSHAILDGETIPLDGKFSNGLRWPADVGAGNPDEIFNCRCSLISVVDGINMEVDPAKVRRANKLVGMSYDDWKAEHRKKWVKENEH